MVKPGLSHIYPPVVLKPPHYTPCSKGTVFPRFDRPRGRGSWDTSGNGDGEATELRRFQIIHKTATLLSAQTPSSLLWGISINSLPPSLSKNINWQCEEKLEHSRPGPSSCLCWVTVGLLDGGTLVQRKISHIPTGKSFLEPCSAPVFHFTC